MAEDERMKAEQSRASADNAYREAMHLSPEQFIQLETIKYTDDEATPVFALERRFLAIIVLRLPWPQELLCDGCSGFGD